MRLIERILAATIAGAAISLALSADQLGHNDGKRPLQLSESVVVLGSKVPPGTYTLRWAREWGTERVRLELVRGKSVVASGRGEWTQAESASPHEALVYHRGNGTQQLTEIRFRGSADAIRVDTGKTEEARAAETREE